MSRWSDALKRQDVWTQGVVPIVPIAAKIVTAVEDSGTATPNTEKSAAIGTIGTRFPRPERTAADWRDLYEERAAIRQYEASYSRQEAERLAWGEVVNEWHMTHGERTPRDHCAGCLKPIDGGEKALDHADGTRTHMADGFGCITKYGDRWRGAAEKALAGMGLVPLS